MTSPASEEPLIIEPKEEIPKSIQEEFENISLKACFDELERRGFILPQAGLSDFDYYFQHVLVSDAIYSTLLKTESSEIHGQVGEAIERIYPERLDELELAEGALEGGFQLGELFGRNLVDLLRRAN